MIGSPINSPGGVKTYDELTDTPSSKVGQAGKYVKVGVGEIDLEYDNPAGSGDVVGPAASTENKVPQWDAANKTLKDGLTLNTTVATPGVDTEIVTGKAVRDAINALGNKTIKATFFATIASGTTSGTITKPAGGNATLIMDEWGTDTDALLSTIANGKPTFTSPVTAGGATVTTTFNTAGEFTFSDTPHPAADHALIFVYTCKLSDFISSESLFETELVSTVASHAASHITGGADVIANAVAGGAAGLMAGADKTKLDGIEAGAKANAYGDAVAKTIASGVVDASDGSKILNLSGEGGAADDLTEIQAAAAGDIVILFNPNAASYSITVKNGTYLKLQADFVLNSVDDSIMLICTNTGANDTFRELSRSNNG